MAGAVGITVEGMEKLNEKLRALAAKHGGGDAAVAVGYTAAYALPVHENVAMKWKGLPRGAGFTRKDGVVIVPKHYLADPQGKAPKVAKEKKAAKRKPKGFYWDPAGRGQAKFLEQPARELQAELGRIVADALLRGATMASALLRAGLRLQRESMLLVPVDTGNLKASAFTRLEFGTVGEGTAEPAGGISAGGTE